MRPARTLLAAVLLLAGAAAVTAVGADGAATRGHLILIGGGEKPPAAIRAFIDLAGGLDAPILVFPTASEDPETPAYMEKVFKGDHGCRNLTVLAVKTRADADRADYVALAEKAGGFFFAGGDQSRITAALLGSPLLEAVRRAHARGAVIAGTSAGLACMSSPMITGNGDFSLIVAGNVELAPGLGFFPASAILDQHFAARQRENRLISVILEHPDRLGVGVDEDTAIWLKPDDTFEVVGTRNVIVLDPSSAAVTRQAVEGGRDRLGVRGLTVHILLPGDGFDLASRAVLPPRTEPAAPAGGRVP